MIAARNAHAMSRRDARASNARGRSPDVALTCLARIFRAPDVPVSVLEAPRFTG